MFERKTISSAGGRRTAAPPEAPRSRCGGGPGVAGQPHVAGRPGVRRPGPAPDAPLPGAWGAPAWLALSLAVAFCLDAALRNVSAEEALPNAGAMHEAVLAESRFPSAQVCAQCHPRQYREWSVSPHAYGQLSPVVMAFQNITNRQASSTSGDFCQRCHAPVSAALGRPFAMSALDRPPVERESITCVACHRVSRGFGRITARYPIEEGDLHEPVYGIDDGGRLKKAIADPKYQLQPGRDEAGRAVHAEVRPFPELRAPAFCGGVCHEVTAQNGARSHEMLTEYKRSPAAARGITCVDCHMGSEQGRPSPFEPGPVAVVGGVPTSERPLSNHFMAGPDYSIVHPGVFPHSIEASRLKTPREWIQFDHEAGWGTDAFEDSVADDHPFPEAWASADDRFDARAIIDEQLELLAWADEQRLEVLRNGFGLSEVLDIRRSGDGLKFSLEVRNLTEGHYVPTSFDIKRTVFLQVTVADSAGNVVYRSGDRDPNGDLRDAHSRYVAAGVLPHDDDLFNLQSKTYVAVLRGPRRSQDLAPPMSVTAMPMVRPDPRPTLLYGRTRGSRKHRTGIPAGQARTATYHVPADRIEPAETYTIEAKLIFQPVPISLIHASRSVGFDYGMSAREVAERIVGGAAEVWRRTATVDRTLDATEDRS